MRVETTFNAKSGRHFTISATLHDCAPIQQQQIIKIITFMSTCARKENSGYVQWSSDLFRDIRLTAAPQMREGDDDSY